MKLFARIASAVAVLAALVASAVVRDKSRDDDEYWETPSEFQVKTAA
ncbi:hypothetical protein BH11ACT2_BH11ACT2_17140 [soil metagenome]